MLPAYKGRINRKTFILGNAVGLTILGVAALIYIVPIALIDIVVNGSTDAHATWLFKILYALFIIPAIFYFFFASVMFVKRLHDIGYPGFMLMGIFILCAGLSRVTDIWIFKIIDVLIVAGVCLLPGEKKRNNFGPVPHKKFNIDNLIIKF